MVIGINSYCVSIWGSMQNLSTFDLTVWATLAFKHTA